MKNITFIFTGNSVRDVVDFFFRFKGEFTERTQDIMLASIFRWIEEEKPVEIARVLYSIPNVNAFSYLMEAYITTPSVNKCEFTKEKQVEVMNALSELEKEEQLKRMDALAIAKKPSEDWEEACYEWFSRFMDYHFENWSRQVEREVIEALSKINPIVVSGAFRYLANNHCYDKIVKLRLCGLVSFVDSKIVTKILKDAIYDEYPKMEKLFLSFFERGEILEDLIFNAGKSDDVLKKIAEEFDNKAKTVLKNLNVHQIFGMFMHLDEFDATWYLSHYLDEATIIEVLKYYTPEKRAAILAEDAICSCWEEDDIRARIAKAFDME